MVLYRDMGHALEICNVLTYPMQVDFNFYNDMYLKVRFYKFILHLDTAESHYFMGNCYYAFHLSNETIDKIDYGDISAFEVVKSTCSGNGLVTAKIVNATVNNFIYDNIIKSNGKGK